MQLHPLAWQKGSLQPKAVSSHGFALGTAATPGALQLVSTHLRTRAVLFVPQPVSVSLNLSQLRAASLFERNVGSVGDCQTASCKHPLCCDLQDVCTELSPAWFRSQHLNHRANPPSPFCPTAAGHRAASRERACPELLEHPRRKAGKRERTAPLPSRKGRAKTATNKKFIVPPRRAVC